MIGRSPAAALGLLIVLGCMVAALAGCGGGGATAEEIAQADADRAEVQTAIDAQQRKSIQPVNCSASGVCK